MTATEATSTDAPTAIVLNESAGSAGTERVRRTVALLRTRIDADLHTVATRDPATLDAWLRERIDPYRRLIVVGGDGTLGVAYNVAADRSGLRLAYVPARLRNPTAPLPPLPRDPDALTD